MNISVLSPGDLPTDADASVAARPRCVEALRPAGTVVSRSFSCWHQREIAYPHNVVCSQGEGEDPVHSRQAAMPHLANRPDRLQPSEDLFDPLPFALANFVRSMACRPAIERAIADLARDVGCHVAPPEVFHKRGYVVR